MKIYVLLVAVFFIACDQNSRSNNTINTDSAAGEYSITDNPKITGHWSMCSASGNGFMRSYNICLEITFSNSGTGLIRQPSGETENFLWTLKNDTLKISNNHNDSNSTFTDTSYAVTIGQKDQQTDLQIQQFNSDGIFYLSRKRIEL